MSQIDENCIPLIGDTRFKEGVETIKELSSILLVWLTKRDDTITLLKDLQKQVEESYQKRTVSKVAGASAAMVGSALGIVGFGLSFVTFGASLGLLIPGLKVKCCLTYNFTISNPIHVGAIIGGAGAVTMAGADVGDWLVSRSHVKTAEQAVERDRESFVILKEKAETLKKKIDELAEEYPSLPKEKILESMGSVAVKGETMLLTITVVLGH